MITRIHYNHSNCYLIKTRNRCILLDTCESKYEYDLLRKLEGVSIDLIILTHGHYDHVGNAAVIREKFQAPILMHSADIDLCKGEAVRPVYADSNIGKMILKKAGDPLAATGYPLFEPDICLNGEGDLSDFGVEIGIMELPGHTKGSIGVAFERALFAGDTINNLYRTRHALVYEDMEKLRDSIWKIRKASPEVIYPGHGDPVENGF